MFTRVKADPHAELSPSVPNRRGAVVPGGAKGTDKNQESKPAYFSRYIQSELVFGFQGRHYQGQDQIAKDHSSSSSFLKQQQNMPAAPPPTQQAPIIRPLSKGTSVVNLLGTAGVDKPPGAKGKSWIKYWEAHVSKVYKINGPVMCCAEDCSRTDRISGSHVKIADGPTTAALFHTMWYIVPACPAHNKHSSCKTFRVKPTVAVEATPELADRVGSWTADIKKVLRTVAGKKH
jgi:hypothetical protein